MESIYHEKQEGGLCAQHCLNNLLQGPYFTAVELASLAKKMDDRERSCMAESGINSMEYLNFMQQPSNNMDDTGFFSIQVISSALEVWNLELVPYLTSKLSLSESSQCLSNLKYISAYICNYKNHWFTIRKIGHQWFDLNSVAKAPKLITDTYLAMFLSQLRREGYAIFAIGGKLPSCHADEVLKMSPIEAKNQAGEPECTTSAQPVDSELEKAIKMSLGENETEDDDELRKVLEMSLRQEDGPEQSLLTAIAESFSPASTSSSKQERKEEKQDNSVPDINEIRKKRLAAIEKRQTKPS